MLIISKIQLYEKFLQLFNKNIGEGMKIPDNEEGNFLDLMYNAEHPYQLHTIHDEDLDEYFDKANQIHKEVALVITKIAAEKGKRFLQRMLDKMGDMDLIDLADSVDDAKEIIEKLTTEFNIKSFNMPS